MQPKLPFPESATPQGHQWEQVAKEQRKKVVEKLARIMEKAAAHNEQENGSDDGHK